MKRFLVLIFVLLPFNALLGQDIELVRDSLRKELATTDVDTTRIILLNDLAAYYWITRYDSGIYFSQEALLQSRKLDYLDGEASALIWLGLSHSALGNNVKGYDYLNQAVNFSESTGNKKRLGEALSALGEILRGDDPEQALKTYYKAYEINKSIEDNAIFVSLNESQIGASYRMLNQLDSALFYIESVFANSEDPMPFAYGTLAEIYNDMGEVDSAIHFYKLGIKESIESEQHVNTSWFYRDLGQIFNEMNDIDSALYYANLGYEKALESRSYEYIIKAADFLSGLYRPLDAERALEFKLISSAVQDSLNNQIEKQGIASIQGFDQQLRDLETEKAEADFRSRLRTNAFLGSSFTLIVIAFLLYRNGRNNRRAKEKVENAYSELKATQDQLIQSEKMASLGEMTAGIAHEIQNPLNFVNNFSDVNKELAEELKEAVEKGNRQEAEAIIKDLIENEYKIHHHGQRADAIVKSMLQHSRGSSGEKEPTDISALCDEYLHLAFHGLKAKDKSFNAEFKLELDETLPKVNVVPQDIGRVILNLVNNAFQAVSQSSELGTANSEYKPLVIVSTRNLNDRVEISVKDNGMGIPEQVRDKIFEPFFTTKATGQGTGLGLSLSYDIVTKGHGGEIRVESEEGKGSEFIVVLPA